MLPPAKKFFFNPFGAKKMADLVVNPVTVAEILEVCTVIVTAAILMYDYVHSSRFIRGIWTTIL
jgi:hypothetical protein